jgi:hypothetical protein
MNAKRLSETHLSYLRMFEPGTYGLSIPYSIAKTLEIKGLVEWVPPKFGTQLWAITAKGREIRSSHTE